MELQWAGELMCASVISDFCFFTFFGVIVSLILDKRVYGFLELSPFLSSPLQHTGSTIMQLR